MPIDPNQDRSKLIGGSEIAGVMAMSRWQSPLSLWAMKTGNIPSEIEMNAPMEMGIMLEPFVATLFEKKSGKKVKIDARDFTHPKYPYMMAHIDYWVVGEDGADVEIKTCSAYKYNEWAEGVPEEIELQKNWCAGMVGLHRGKPPKDGYVAVLVGGQHFIWKPVKFDQELFDIQVEKAREFWEEYVLKDIPPMAVAGDQDTLVELFPESRPDALRVLAGEDPDLEATVNELALNSVEGKNQIKEIEVEVDDSSNKIRQLIGDDDGIETGQFKCTWRTQGKVKIDIVKLKEDGLYDVYAVRGTSRVLRILEKKAKQ